MNRELLDKICERGILVLVLAILIITPLAFGGVPQIPIGSSLDLVLVNPFVFVEGIMALALVLWLARLWINPRPKLLWPPLCWVVVAFCVYAIVRYLTAQIEYVARAEMLQVLVCGFLFLIIVNNLHRQESVQIAVLSLVFLAMAISGYAIYQFATGSKHVWALTTPYVHRGTGTYISPNNLSGLLEMILPLGLAFTLVSRLSTLTKVFTGYASMVILVGICVTISRGSWVATAIALVVLFMVLLAQRAYRLPALALLIVTIAAGIHFAPQNFYLQARLRHLQNPQGTLDDDARLAIWKVAMQLWQTDIWWGIGPGHFNSRFGEFRPESIQTSPDRVHNDYLNTLTDWGIAGTAIIAIAAGLMFAGAIQTGFAVRRSSNALGEQRSSKLALVLGATAGLIAILVHSFVDFNMHVPANAMVAVALMAWLTCYLRFATDRYWTTARGGAKGLLTVVIVAGIAYLGWQTVRSTEESHWLIKGKLAKAGSTEEIAALEKAFSMEPKNGETARAIGEAYRLRSWEGMDDYKDEALEAMKWFKRAMDLNPYDDSSLLRYGMCLDQIDRHDEALTSFSRALQIDPNSYFDNAWMGWHYTRTGDYAAARIWLERSRRLEPTDNPIADSYLRIANQQLIESATNSSPVRFP